jgi:hypothetical protein
MSSVGSFEGVDSPGIFISLGTSFQSSITLFFSLIEPKMSYQLTVLWIHIGFNPVQINLFTSMRSGSREQSHADTDPDPDPGQTLPSQIVKFYMKKYSLRRLLGRKHRYLSRYESVIKRLESDLFVSFSLFLVPDSDQESQYCQWRFLTFLNRQVSPQTFFVRSYSSIRYFLTSVVSSEPD